MPYVRGAMGMIGCTDDYQVLIVRQPGTVTGQGSSPDAIGVVSEIVDLEWTRNLSDISSARVSFPQCTANCEFFPSPEGGGRGVQPWAYEMWIYRDGKIAFQGPIVYTRKTRQGIFEMDARDIGMYLARHEMPTYYAQDETVVNIAKSMVITYHTTPQPPYGNILDPMVNDYTIVLDGISPTIEVEWDRAQYTIMEKWRDPLVRAGLTFTSYGRYLLLHGPTPFNASNPFIINCEDIIGDYSLVQDGINYGSHVVGLGEGLTRGVGPSLADQAFYGHISYPPTRFSDIRDQTNLDDVTDEFYRVMRDISPQLIVESGSRLSPEAEIYNTGFDFTIPGVFDPVAYDPALPDLICGMQYNIQVTDECLEGLYPMRLENLQVTWSSSQGERVSVGFIN